MGDELVTLATFDKRGDADVCKVVLEQHGIRVFLADDNMVGGTNFLYGIALGGIKVQVASSDAERAAALLEKGFQSHWGFTAQPQGPGQDTDVVRFACEHCGESVNFSFSAKGSVQICPECGEYIDVPES